MSEHDEHANDAAGAATGGATADGSAADESAGGRGGAAHGLAYEQARLAYSIIQTLLEHTRVTQDLVALLAQVVDEDTQKALTETPHWSAYMDSRRAMERARGEIERFAAEWTKMAADAPGPPAGGEQPPPARPPAVTD